MKKKDYSESIVDKKPIDEIAKDDIDNIGDSLNGSTKIYKSKSKRNLLLITSVFILMVILLVSC